MTLDEWKQTQRIAGLLGVKATSHNAAWVLSEAARHLELYKNDASREDALRRTLSDRTE